MRPIRILLVAAVASIVVLAACTDAGDDTAADTTSDAASATTIAPSGRDSAEDTDAAGQASAGGGDEAAADADEADGAVTDVREIDLVAAQVDRRIVYTGELRSEVDDVAVAARSARDAVGAEGGFVFGQEISGGEARVVLKVPSLRFDAAFDAVAGIGEVTSQFIEADDVSEQFTDLESRLDTLATSIDRLRGFLAEAANVDEISRLEGELTRREAEHDVIAGQLRVLRDRTSLGTITVTFRAVEENSEVVVDDGEGGPPGFGRGLEVGWDAVVVITGAAATAAGFALPFAPLVLVMGGALWWLRRGARPSRA